MCSSRDFLLLISFVFGLGFVDCVRYSVYKYVYMFHLKLDFYLKTIVLYENCDLGGASYSFASKLAKFS